MAADYNMFDCCPTTFDELYDRFYSIIMTDKSFFNRKDMTEAELREVISFRSDNFLQDAVTDFVNSSNYDGINLADYIDFEERTFLIKLNMSEMTIIAWIMFEAYMETKVTERVNALGGLHFSDNEMRVFNASSSDLNSFNKTMGRLSAKNQKRIRDYKARDRDTGQRKRFDWSQLGG
ncbi:MAG: hypothetical protein ACRC1P_11435 [Cellulosilyticaceae bacterium]